MQLLKRAVGGRPLFRNNARSPLPLVLPRRASCCCFGSGDCEELARLSAGVVLACMRPSLGRQANDAYKARCAPSYQMPLTPALMKMVLDILVCVDAPKRRRAFDALRPVINLGDDEVDAEFARVEGVLRYVAQVEADLAKLRRVHLHRVPCKVQALLTSRRMF